MNLIEPLRFAVLGLGAGGIFGLIALGLVITYRGSGVINFAQGAIAMTGAFTFYFLVHERHWAFLPALVGGVLVSSLVGTAFAYLVLRRLRHAAAVTRLIATLTLLVVLQEGVSLQFGNDVIVLRPALPIAAWTALGLTIGADKAIIFLISVVAMVVLWFI